MSHKNQKLSTNSISNPKQSSDDQNIIKVHPSHNPIKKLIQFVSIFPNHPNIVCFIFADQNSVPKKFFSLYPSTGTDFQNFGVIYIEAYINQEKTLMIGLDKSFINLANDSDNQQITQKHLIFMYLLKKFQSVKFVLCFDEHALKQSALLTFKNTINRLATTLDFQKRKDYGKSFMILLSHSNEQETQEIQEMCEAKLQQSISQQFFFRQNHKFAKQIISDIFKPSRKSQKRILSFLNKFTQNQFNDRRESFEKIIQITRALQGNEIFDIKQQFYTILQVKSMDWKPFEPIKNQQNDKTADMTKNSSKNNASTPIQNFFLLWSHTFSQLIKFIGQKIMKGKNSFEKFAKTQVFLIDKSTNKFHPNFMPAQQNNNKNLSKAYQASYFLSRLMSLLHKDAQEYDKLKNEDHLKIKIQFFRLQLKTFFQVLYECQILSSKNQKVIYDFFMVMDQLVSLWKNIKIFNDQDQTWVLFFTSNNQMQFSLSNNLSVRKLISNIAKALNFILNIEFSRIQKGQYVELESIETSMIKIKQTMDEHIKIEQGMKFLENQSLRKTIAKYEKELRIRKATKLSDKPLTRIGFTLKYLKKQSDIIQNNQLLNMFAKSCLDYVRQYKEDKSYSLVIKLKIIELLELDMGTNLRLISEIYQDQIDAIIEKARKNTRPFDDNQAIFVLKYTDFAIKLGLLQKLREKAYEISVFDKILFKKILCKALLMKECAKLQLEFIKSDKKLKKTPVSAQEEQQQKIDLGITMEAIDTLDRHFKKEKFSEEILLKEEQHLLDI